MTRDRIGLSCAEVIILPRSRSLLPSPPVTNGKGKRERKKKKEKGKKIPMLLYTGETLNSLRNPPLLRTMLYLYSTLPHSSLCRPRSGGIFVGVPRSGSRRIGKCSVVIFL